MFEKLISGGTLVNAEEERKADLAIADGRIAAILPPGERVEARRVLDVSGCLLLPGLVDVHAHLREPGLTHKEDFPSGTHAGALGGVTTILDMPTDLPWTASAEQLAAKMDMASNRIHVDVGFQAVLSRKIDRIGALLELNPVSLELFTADVPEGFLFPTLDAVVELLKCLSGTDTTVGISPGDESILLGRARRGSGGDVAAFLASRPPLAEANGIARAVLAAAATRARIHVRQINSKLGVETWTRLRGLADASVETTPQNFFFSSDCYSTAHGARLKASPPFRSQEDIAALREALRVGLIDIVATDHAPHTPTEKAASYAAFADIPGGMPGLQTLLQAMLKLVDEGVILMRDIVRVCARNPAERFGLGWRKGRIAPGYDADILVLDPQQESVIANAGQVSKAGYTPFDGWRVKARLRRVFLRGEEIVREGVLVREAQGQIVVRGG
jgi:dihydroorotase